MKELQMDVQQTPGVIHWNFEELKTQLKEEMKTYETTVYTDDAIMEAKTDLAMLRKFRKSVEDRRKEIKKKCLEPYEIVDEQAKELVALIDKPIELINEKVAAYDKTQREARKKRILDYMNDTFADLPDLVGQRLKFKCYDTKWENTNTSISSWKSAIDEAHENCIADLEKLHESVDDEFLPEAMKIYEKNLKIADAENAFNKYLQHKVQILEAEQRRKEEEMRRQREAQERAIRLAEEKARAEEAERIRKEQEAARAAQEEAERKKVEENVQAVVNEQEEPAGNEIHENSEQHTEVDTNLRSAVLRISGTAEQIRKVKGYARYCGAYFEVLEEL